MNPVLDCSGKKDPVGLEMNLSRAWQTGDQTSPNLKHLSPFIQTHARGVIIVFCILLNTTGRREKEKRNRRYSFEELISLFPLSETDRAIKGELDESSIHLDPIALVRYRVFE